jgi:hypothetical protein
MVKSSAAALFVLVCMSWEKVIGKEYGIMVDGGFTFNHAGEESKYK